MNKRTEQMIAKLEADILLLKARDNRLSSIESEYQTFRVGMHENNSGGSYWLSQGDYNKLEADGWTVYPRARGIVREYMARSADEASDMARADFSSVASYDADDEGCNCCGQPFWFEVERNGEKFYWENPEGDGYFGREKGVYTLDPL